MRAPSSGRAAPGRICRTRSCPGPPSIAGSCAYTGERVGKATSVAVTIVSALEGQEGFAVHPKRWVMLACTMVLGFELSISACAS